MKHSIEIYETADILFANVQAFDCLSSKMALN